MKKLNKREKIKQWGKTQQGNNTPKFCLNKRVNC